MKIITWLFIVLPFVSLVWFYDVISLACRIIVGKYYVFAYSRSSYLQERALLDAYVESCKQRGQKPWPNYN